MQDQTARASEARLLESEVARLREDNANLKKELIEAQGVEKERKKLQDKNERLEAKMEDMIADKVAAKEAELNATYDERLRNYEDRERDLQKQVSLVRSQLRDLRTSNESTQAKLLDQGSRQGESSPDQSANKLEYPFLQVKKWRHDCRRWIFSMQISSEPTAALPRWRGGTRN